MPELEQSYAQVVAVGNFALKPQLPVQNSVSFFLTEIQVRTSNSLSPILYNNNAWARGNEKGIIIEPPVFVPFFTFTPGGGEITASGVIYSRTADTLSQVTGSDISSLCVRPYFGTGFTPTYTNHTLFVGCKCVGAELQAVLYKDVYILAGTVRYRYSRATDETM